jgi:NAD(P)-dependent dehydrogenase (short-subunit alcohol dehydrogenase family)
LAAGDVRICTRIPHPQIESLNRIVEKIKAEKIKAAGGKSIAVQGSVTSSREIDCFFNQTEKQLGKVAVLVNNAGVFAYGGGRKLGSFMDGRNRPTKNFAVTENGRREGSGFVQNPFQPAIQDEVI